MLFVACCFAVLFIGVVWLWFALGWFVCLLLASCLAGVGAGFDYNAQDRSNLTLHPVLLVVCAVLVLLVLVARRPTEAKTETNPD